MKAEKVYDQTFTARNFNTSPLTISGLEGDKYDYECVVFVISSSATASEFQCLANNDSGSSNYRVYFMRGYGATANAIADDTRGYAPVAYTHNSTVSLGKFTLSGSSGDERYFDIFQCGDNSIANEVRKSSVYWKNTADEVSSLVFKSTASINSDAHIILYRTPKEASQEKWELVDTYNASGVNYNTSPTTIFSNLKGDTDLQYKLVIRTDTGFDSRLRLRMNGDSGANYTAQRLSNNGGTISAGNSTGRNGFQWSDLNIDHDSVATIIINAESGAKRLIPSSESNNQTKGNEQDEQACWWNNTVDELTSIVLYDATNVANDTIEAKLYRRKNPNTIGDTLPFEMVEEVAVSGDFSAGHTFSGLSGDDVLLYKLEFIGDNVIAATPSLNVQINGDTGSNYSRQYLYGSTSSVAAGSATTTSMAFAFVDEESTAAMFLYPKSGNNRPILNHNAYRENTIYKQAFWWNNSSDVINSIKVFASATTSITGTLRLSKYTI